MEGLSPAERAQIVEAGIRELDVQIEQTALKLTTLESARQTLVQKRSEIESGKEGVNASTKGPQKEL